MSSKKIHSYGTKPEANSENSQEQPSGDNPEAVAQAKIDSNALANSKANWLKPARRRPNTRTAGSAP